MGTLFDELVRVESANLHLVSDEARAQVPVPEGEQRLHRSRAGALGLPQLMPHTMLSPGYNVSSIVPAQHRAELWGMYHEYLAAESRGDTKALREKWDAFVTRTEELTRDVPESEWVRFAWEYLNGLLVEFGGDIEKALAAYNAGPGTVGRVIAAHGDDWLENMSEGVRNYVRTIKAGG